MATLSTDTFTRANAASWGTSSGGETWSHPRGTDTLSIASNEGLDTGGGSSVTNVMLLGSQTAGNVEVLVRFTQSVTTVIAGSVAHYVDSTHWYSCTVGTIAGNLAIRKDVAGTFSTVAQAAFTTTAGTFYWIRYRITGSTGNWSHQAKIWQDGSGEPGSWTIPATSDSSMDAGQYGLSAMCNSSGNNAKFDSLTVTDAASTATHLLIGDGMGGVFS